MRLIDAAELMTIADEVTFMGFQAVERKKSFMDLISAMLKHCTPIEAEPVRHGRWKPTAEYDSCYCSRCLKQYTGFFASDWNYCPNCGARMDGESE